MTVPADIKAMGVIRGRMLILPLIASEKFIFSRRIILEEVLPALEREDWAENKVE
jgi:hypothetical protein